jgi:hypothetical protein
MAGMILSYPKNLGKQQEVAHSCDSNHANLFFMMTTAPSETFPSHWQPLNESDAHFLGRLSVAGLALPNAPGLSLPALEVIDITSPDTQSEIDRLVAAAEGIASIPGTTFAGLHHAQLATTEAVPHPLQILLAPAEIRGLPIETTIGGMAFQALVNTNLVLPTITNPRQLTATKEGCFSSGPVTVVTHRPNSIKELTTHSRDGEMLTETGMDGFRAIVVEHEVDHGAGKRAADTPDIVRNWVSRDKLPKYRTVRPSRHERWPDRCFDEQWQALSRDPDYPFLHTEQLREAFEAGVAAQRVIGN